MKVLIGKINDTIYTYGQEEAGPEGVLFTPITQFILAIADSVMSTMQGAFIGSGTSLGNIIHSGEIKIKSPDGKNHQNAGITRYSLKYTPKAIFSGEIPAFDTNFFDPMGDDHGVVEFVNTKMTFKPIRQGIDFNYCTSNYGASGNLLTSKDKLTTAEAVAGALGIICTINAVEALANIDNDIDWAAFGAGGGGGFLGFEAEVDVDYSIPVYELDAQGIASAAMFTAGAAAAGATYATLEAQDTNMYYSEWKNTDGKTYFFIAESPSDVEEHERNELSGGLYEIEEVRLTTVNEKYSAAFQLRPIISKWYIGLRNFSLVGLLSMLLYTGIRIIISSTSQQKSKYKKLLIDWLVALCLLFLLHYLMSFITHISGALCDVFNTGSSLSDGTDIFATKIRNMATGDGVSSYMQYFGFVVIYIALTVLTVIFTIQYTKRLVTLAFLTIISPLISLTYPIDAMGDGKAQAFSYWLKEYIFNSLLQPMHLLLYTIFISGAYELMDVNPVYAIIVLSFFVSAEQIFRKIFGFDKANTTSTLGAAAGGAMMMNMFNRMKGSTRTRKGNSANRKGIRLAPENMGNNVGNLKDNGKENNTTRSNLGNMRQNRLGNNNDNNNYLENNSDDNLVNMRQNRLNNNDSNNNYLEDNLSNIRQDRLGNNYYLANNLDDNLGNIRQDKLSNVTNYKNLATESKANIQRPNVGQGVKNIRRLNVGQGVKNVAKGLAKRTIKGAASITKSVFKKAPGAIAGAAIGTAAAVASGGQNAAPLIGGGIVAGAAMSNNIAEGVSDTVKSGAKKVKQDYKSGAQKQKITKKEKENLEGYKKIMADKKIQDICKKDGLEVKDSIKSFIDNGITDPNKIRFTIENGKTQPNKINPTKKNGKTQPDKINSTIKNKTAHTNELDKALRETKKVKQDYNKDVLEERDVIRFAMDNKTSNLDELGKK